jgi:hypothetical protein
MASISAGQQAILSATNGSAANALLLYDTSVEGSARGVYIIGVAGTALIAADPIHRGPTHTDTPDDLDYFTIGMNQSVTLRFDAATRCRIYAYATSGTAVVWMGVVEG